MVKRINVDGVDREMVAAEEADYDKGVAEVEKTRPQRNWRRDMHNASEDMPPDMEEIWDAVGTDNATQKVKDAYDAKKEVSARQP